MNQHRDDEGRYSERGHGIGTVTEEMVRKRAAGIALRNGRSEHNLLDSDLAQARRELTGEERLSPKPDPTETIPNKPRWEENTGSEGGRNPPIPAPDEQTFAEKLVKEGVADAEQERAEEATRASSKKDNA
jgi:hypothetical protein